MSLSRVRPLVACVPSWPEWRMKFRRRQVVQTKSVEQRCARSRGGSLAAAAIVCVALMGAAACSSSKSESAKPAAVTTTTQPRSAGPIADMSREAVGGNGVFIGSATPANLQQVGYVEHEYVAAGTATSYKRNGAISHDGRWRFVPGATAPYRTRVLVRRPAAAKVFSGTVVVEWLNG